MAALALFIFYTSVLTSPPETPVDKLKPVLLPLDKWRHFLAYAALTLSVGYATVNTESRGWRSVLSVVIPVALYGVGIEVGQSFIPERYFSVSDAYANLLGVLLASPWFYLETRLNFVPVSEYFRKDTQE
ncbi:MAG: VanZ family protein [Halobacteria archaeon]